MTLGTENARPLTCHPTDQSTIKAQLEFFIRLGNMEDLQPGEDFAAVMDLGNALISGEIDQVQSFLSKYGNQTTLLLMHVEFLRKAFNHTGIQIQDPSIIRYEGPLGQQRRMVVLSILIERLGKIVFISSERSQPSYVHSFVRNSKGIMTLEPAKEDPALFLRQIGRLIRLPDVPAPPPPFIRA